VGASLLAIHGIREQARSHSNFRRELKWLSGSIRDRGHGGIGTAICKRLAADGNRSWPTACPAYDKKEEWLTSMRAPGYAVHAAEGNVEEFDSCADMFYRIGSIIGPVDILVNNAASPATACSSAMSESDWYERDQHQFEQACSTVTPPGGRRA